ncbi:hypothetical protein FB451DRAFT_1260124 [Mycena latifolia]|nr:hypothetical protein FB451DRAFT_1260124 [Mycena latifolia]
MVHLAVSNTRSVPQHLMASSTKPINAVLDDVQVAHDEAAQIMAQISTATNLTDEDRQALQDFYTELEQRRALLSQGGQARLLDPDGEDEEDEDDIPKDADLAKAAEFPTFLKSLDPSDNATKLLIEGSARVVAALRTVEKGASFLTNVPLQKVLEMYESITSREERLKTAGGPVSLVNAQIYSSETTAFADMVQGMIMLDMRASIPDEMGGSVEVAPIGS